MNAPERVHFENDFILELKDVKKTFSKAHRQVHALNGVSISVQKGKVTGLIGPDGAGKTTLMRLSACLIKPDAGKITVLNLDTEKDALKIQADLGYMPQRFGLYEDLTVQENLDLYASLQGIFKEERITRYETLMKMTNLGPFTERLAGQLSGGMKQKLGLACTLVRSPALLILDEPTVGVDPVSRRELWEIINRLVNDEGVGILVSTAYLDEAERCDEVILLHEGNVLDQAPPGEFSQKMDGRTYFVTADLRKRTLQEELSQVHGVVDAVIQGEGVRLVMTEPVQPDLSALLSRDSRLKIQPVSPRFEDNYIALLHQDMGSKRTDRPEVVAPEKELQDKWVIQVDHVKRRFGTFYAVNDITFKVSRGEVFGLLGANGAGKTTTFRMLCGLLPVSGGRVRVTGLDLRKAAARARAHIGYMSQRFSLYGNLTVMENIKFFSSAYGLKGTRRQKKIEWALEQFRLEDLTAAKSGELPPGYKQRLALSCALMHDPEILFLDEPTSGVDPVARREFWHQINNLADSGVTVLITTHFMEEAEYCDRLAIMASGEILALGTPPEIKDQASGQKDRAAETMEQAFISLIQAENPE